MIATLTHFPSLAFGFGFAVLLFAASWAQPRVLAAAWLATICFVPWWIGLDFHTFFPAATIVSLFALLCLPVVFERLTLIDWTVFTFGAACLLPVFVAVLSNSALFGLLLVWLPGYLIGRLLPGRVDAQWIYGCIAVMFTAVSLLALLEFFTRYNYFVHITTDAGPSYQIWGTLQERGGRLRAEGAFGHSIALGSSLALAIPLTLASRFRLKLRVCAVVLMLGASAVTFSRTGILCSVLGAGLSIVFLRDGLTARMRAAALTAVVALSAALLPFILSTFAAAGSEASGSAGYRGQLTSLIGDMQLLGLSNVALQLPDGAVFFGQFKSIDSQLVLTGLTYGWAPLAVVMLLLVAAVGAVVLGRATAPTIAIAAQIPSFATVALITQYSVFVFFVAGLAVATQATRLVPPSARVPSRQLRAMPRIMSFTRPVHPGPASPSPERLPVGAVPRRSR